MEQDNYCLLSNGNKMPKIGLGTDDVFFVNPPRTSSNKLLRKILSIYNYRVKKPLLDKEMSNKFIEAFNSGYRLIDTSAAYNNEYSIGRAVRECNVKREDIFLTTRCTNKAQYEGTVCEEFMQSLKKMGVEYIDLYMFHWPVTNYYLDTWRVMEQLYEEGYVRNLGFANCHKHHIEEILKICKVRPVLNQIEIHPLFTQKPLIEYCKSEGIQVEAYSPLAKNDDRLRRNRVIGKLADKYNKSRTQIIIRWHIENGVIPVPRSMNTNRMIHNLEVFDFCLTPDEIAAIDAININSRLRYDPDNCDFTLL